MRSVVRWLLVLLGVLAILMGGLWVLQGFGLVMWPADSFMLADRQWAVNGAIVMLLGVALIYVARRLRSSPSGLR